MRAVVEEEVQELALVELVVLVVVAMAVLKQQHQHLQRQTLAVVAVEHKETLAFI
jgi:hypothetical protein